MNPVLSTLRKLGYNVMNYLDDIVICGDTFAECRDAVLATVNLLLKLGFSQPIPVQKNHSRYQYKKLNILGFLLILLK